MKRCTTCKKWKAVGEFTAHKRTADRLQCSCRACINARRRQWHKDNRAQDAAKHAAMYVSFQGWCKIRWNSLRLRCEGQVPHCAHLYGGLPYCSWEDFWEWANENKETWEVLVEQAQRTGKRRDRPSIDRTQNEGGYVRGNMSFMALGDNSRKAWKQRDQLKETR